MKGLILDDDRAICEYIASALEESGVEHHLFLDPVEALEQMGDDEYDFAFVDINLPNMDGLEFSRRFKNRFPEADIIFITGHGDYQKAVQAIKVGAYDYIQKAFRRLDIILCVSRLIEKRQLYQDKKRMELLRFANDVALDLMHELRNPVVAIGGFSKLISTKDLPEERQRRFADIIFEESVRLETVLKEILEHLKAGAQRHVLADEGSGLSSRRSGKGRHGEAPDSWGAMGQRKRGTEEGLEVQGVKRRVTMAKSEKKRTQTRKKTGEKNSAVATGSSNNVAATGNGIQKKYLSDKRLCEVTFKLPGLAAADAKKVSIVGDFNDWENIDLSFFKNSNFTC